MHVTQESVIFQQSDVIPNIDALETDFEIF